MVIGGKEMIFDHGRSKYVRLTPEEWVRQHLVQFLVREKGAPAGLIALEKSFSYFGALRRADVIVFGRNAAPVLLAETKAPEVSVGQDTLDQVAAYNKVVRARILVATNGFALHVVELDFAASSYRYLDAIPHYDDLR